MGNRSSTVQPAGPPPLLSAAVMGDFAKFQEIWRGEDCIKIVDRQQNNVLHALFSCRGIQDAQCAEILSSIHVSLSESQLKEAYDARNTLGCTPLWILVAYGNVALLKHVQAKFANQPDTVKAMLQAPNDQGDSPFLATCSQGNTEMVQYFREEILTPEQFSAALTDANKKGTTPLQIIVGNSHLELLTYVLDQDNVSLEEQVMQVNAAGLSLFHICCERNAHEALQVLLSFMAGKDDTSSDVEVLEKVLSLKDKNGANCLHVAAFCGNLETVKLWIKVVQKACGSDKSAVALLDKMDGEARTAYWLAMVQGRDDIGQVLAETGVDTVHPKMVQEITDAQGQREAAAAARQTRTRTVDGAALLGR
jgi:ankyrin repeat protein